MQAISWAVVRLLFAPLRALARAGLRAFGRRYDYDTAYLAAMLEHSPGAFLAFTFLAPLTAYPTTAPAGALFAAKLVGAVSEDCGPCTQLVVNLAREQRVAEGELRAVLERDVERMGPDTRLGFRFAAAIIGRTGDEDAARDEVRARWGEAGVVDLTLAFAVGRVFPMTKAGMGYAHECRLVQVGDAPVLVRHESLAG